MTWIHVGQLLVGDGKVFFCGYGDDAVECAQDHNPEKFRVLGLGVQAPK